MGPQTAVLVLLLVAGFGHLSVAVNPDATVAKTVTTTTASSSSTNLGGEVTNPSTSSTAQHSSTSPADVRPTYSTTASQGPTEAQPVSTVKPQMPSANGSTSESLNMTNISTVTLPMSSTPGPGVDYSTPVTNVSVTVTVSDMTTDGGVSTNDDVTSGGENLTTTPMTKKCPKPSKFPHGTSSTNGTSIIFQCYHGYQMQGDGVSHCLQNGTWSRQHPVCVAIATSPPPGTDWTSVFTYFIDWRGAYHQGEKSFPFTLTVTHVNRTQGAVRAQFHDQNTLVVMQGRRLPNSTIKFTANEVRRPNHRIVDTHFELQGELTSDNRTYSFKGFIKTASAIYSMAMTPIPDNPSARMQNKAAQALIVALSVLLALCVLLALGLVLYQVMKRNGLLSSPRSRGTLTSFENPVYEFENSLNASLTGGR